MQKYIIPMKCCIDKEIKKSSSQTFSPSGEECAPEPPPEGPGGPGNDNADDNFSYFDGIVNVYNLAPEAVIFTWGHWQESLKLFGGLKFDGDNTAERLLEATPFLIIPGGALSSFKNDTTFKLLLDKYVSLGGNIFVFAQQFGEHIDGIVPLPEGETLKSYGWREDQSCLKNSVYFDSIHPVLSSSGNQQVDAGVDGYFSSYPSNFTILLRRQTNREPALLYYHYGEGTVILTSMFTDWAYSHSQASTGELKLVRDLITFAKNPKLPIPMYNLTDNTTPTIGLTVEVKNNTEQQALKAKLFVYTPDRNTLLYETEASITIAPQESGDIPISFTLPVLENENYGICHTFYELYDGENNLIQMQSESAGGRFAIYKTPEPYTSPNDIDMWLTVESEYIYWDEKPKVTIHIKNNTNEQVTDCGLAYDWWHHNRTDIAGTFSLAPGENKTITFEPTLKRIYNHRTAMESLWVHLHYYSHKYKYLTAGKGIRVLFPRTRSTITFPAGKQTYRFGFPIDYRFNILNETGEAVNNTSSGIPRPIDVNVKLSVVKGYWHYDEKEIETLYEAPSHIEENGTFNYPGSYTTTTTGITRPGEYRFKLEITKPDGSKEIHYKDFSYQRSSIGLNVDINNQGWIWAPGQQVDFTIKLKNYDDMDIVNGKYTLTAVNKETNQPAFLKESTAISLPGRSERTFEESVVFTPAAAGDYIFTVVYSDETRTADLPTRFARDIRYKLNARLSSDKTEYHFLDTANVGLNIEAVGRVHAEFKCERANIDDAFSVELASNNPFYKKDYSVLLSSPLPYEMYYKVSDEAGNVKEGKGYINKKNLLLKSWARPGELIAKEGNTYRYRFVIRELSGMTTPVDGILSVSCASLGFNESRSLSILPAVENLFDFAVPIPESVPEGIYKKVTILYIYKKSLLC